MGHSCLGETDRYRDSQDVWVDSRIGRLACIPDMFRSRHCVRSSLQAAVLLLGELAAEPRIGKAAWLAVMKE